jgi:tRNA pseudouridine38-40 synthase
LAGRAEGAAEVEGDSPTEVEGVVTREVAVAPTGEREAAQNAREANPNGPLRRVMALVAYDGGGYHGFAAQSRQGIETVGGVLGAALSKMVGTEVAVTCAGRTDVGVHALGQVIHADLPADVVERWLASEPRRFGPVDAQAQSVQTPRDLRGLAKSLTTQCGPAIVVSRALLAPPGFDARHSAVARRYRYEILRGVADPLLRSTTWNVPGELDLAAMRMAADVVLGEHDFSAFCRRPPGHEGPLTRRVAEVKVAQGECGRRLVVEIEANAFCHQMVRALVGALVAVGQGKLTAADVLSLLKQGERSPAAQPAPAQGLCLVLVRYPDEHVPGGVLTPLPA